ncbi:MAG: extracellular solute-binding protein [Polyangiaceae bacterium]
MKLMPLPAWEPGGRRTSTWGGSGLGITRAGKQPDLAWEFAKFLYFDKAELGRRFLDTNIIPPFRDAWNLPEFKRKNPFYSNQELGTMYATLAPEAPPTWGTAYSGTAEGKLNEAFLRAANHFKSQGEAGLPELIRRELRLAEDYVNAVMARNVLASR